MRRGDICRVDLEPALGAEANKRRPAIIVSNDGANSAALRLGRGVVTIVPITSNIGRVYPFQVFLAAVITGLDRDSKARAEQVRSIAVGRVGNWLGSVPLTSMDAVDAALRLQLSL